MDFIYICYSLEQFRIILARKLFADEVMNKEIIDESKKVDDYQKLKINKNSNPTKKKKGIIKAQNNSKDTKTNLKSGKNVYICVVDDKLLKKAIGSEKSLNVKSNIINKIKSPKLENKKESIDELINIKKIKEEKQKEENINELPFAKAIKVDNRNIFHIFYSFLIDKLELVSIFCYDYKVKSILLAEYILGLLINFFFNALLYSDEVVSDKYHNNGKLDFAVSFVLSIISNIISSIFCYYIKYSKGIEGRVDLIMEIRYKTQFYRNIKQLLLYLRIKFICFFIAQLIIIFTCMYYIVIFCIKYSCSQKSLIVNYCYSLIESIITSFAITFIILITRKLGLSCANKELYNTSKYINSKF